MDTGFNILIIDDVDSGLLDRLNDLSISFDYCPNIPVPEVSKKLASYEGLVVRSKLHIDANILDENPQLKLICRVGSGMDNIVVAETDKRGITCVNAPEANCDSVAEQAIGMLLSMLHNINHGSREVALNIWDREGNRGRELNALTVGIIGFGHTGSAVARKLKSFGCKIIAYDKYLSGFGNDTVQEVSYLEIMRDADVVSFHIPLTEETEGWVNMDFVNSLKQPIYLLNLSRGKIMKGEAVLKGLESKRIIGFAADVLENENLNSLSEDQKEIFDKLKLHKRVILTPHVGGWTVESYKKLSQVIGDKIEEWLVSNKISKNSALRNGHFVG